MSTVVDIGCAPQGKDESIAPLIRRFQPEVLYGFDPLLDEESLITSVDGIPVYLNRSAAWTFDGEKPLTIGEGPLAICTTLVPDDRPVAGRVQAVPVFDIARFIEGHAPSPARARPGGDGELILKLDVEGAEYALLEHLISTGAAVHVDLLLVEWHEIPGGQLRRDAILAGLAGLRCKVEPWE